MKIFRSYSFRVSSPFIHHYALCWWFKKIEIGFKLVGGFYITVKHDLSKYAQNLPVSKEFNRFCLGLREKKNFSRELNDLTVKCVIGNRSEKSGNRGPAFCIVHFNAPDFLLLNIKQLNLIYPNNKIYVLDNGSQKSCLKELVTTLQKFKNVRLFSVSSKAIPDHTLGLQFLLNYSAKQQDEFSVFLDQDCILCRNLDNLLLKFRSQKDLLIIGARDFRVPKMVHPSFMIVKPKKIIKLFGRIAFSPHPRAWEEPRDNEGNLHWNERYYGISHMFRRHILFLEAKKVSENSNLTTYSYEDVIYAIHAWYSSRTSNLSVQDSLDGIPVSLLLNSRKNSYEYMEQIHEFNFGGIPQ
jgi:hypothetical protein